MFQRLPLSKLFLTLHSYLQGFIHLFYPHICLQCATTELLNNQVICDCCELQLPYTYFITMGNSPVDKIFWGRAQFQKSNAVLFFTKESIVQKIIFELKYKQNKKAGLLLGRLIAQEILSNLDYPPIDYLIPIPISKQKLRKRGFNQCQIICEGMVSYGLNAPLFQGLSKIKNTQTQTHKDRLQRSNQSNDLFKLTNADILVNKNILIIDDVLTTGATIEAAYHCLIQAKPSTICISTAAYTLT